MAEVINERPAFEVRDFEGGKTFRIWADGRTEGFEDLKSCVVVNRIPQLADRSCPSRK